MALINCPECKTEVSDSAFKCPKCAYQLRKLEPSDISVMFAVGFFLFNIFMFILMANSWLTYSESVGGIFDILSNERKLGVELEKTKEILEFWVYGDIILGLLMLTTAEHEW